MKADPFAQLRLLDVQDLDSRLDLLRHQQRTMPENAELEKLVARDAELRDQQRDARIRVDDLTRDQKKADTDVEQVRSRRTRDQDRIDRGTITNPKDLQRMQQELVSLNRRITELEDIELEVMEQLEAAQAELGRIGAEIERLEGTIATIREGRDAKAEKLNAEAGEVAEERTRTATGVPEDLMNLYARLREQKGGVGAAALRARQCGGCRLSLNAADLGRIAKEPDDEVVRCEECNRILVRTLESGL